MATSTKTSHGNKDQLVREALAHAEAKKTEGNSLFKQGKNKQAAEEYNNALNELRCLSDLACPQPEDSALTLVLHSNLSACHQAMCHYEQAATEAQAALALNPLHTKARFRLCKARFSLEQLDEAAEAMLVIVALTLPEELDRTTFKLYRDILVKGYHKLKLPRDIESLSCVASNTELRTALLQGKSHVVLRPGSYTVAPVTVEGSLALIGVGKVEIRSGGSSHALYVKSGKVYACNLDLAGNMKQSVVCVGGAKADLCLVDCNIQDHKNVGILVLKGHATLKRCTFTNIEQQAVDVRANASVELQRCCIAKCQQGVIAHGGARKLNISNCEIKDTAREGVLVYGESPGVGTPPPRGIELSLREGLQIVSTMIMGCGYHGVLFDVAISPVITRSVITNSVFVNNSPFAISAKGAIVCMIAGCYIKTGTKSGGICVTANYNGLTQVKDNTFVVPVWRKYAIAQEGSTFLPCYVEGTNSAMVKSVTCQNNHIFVGTLPEAPTQEELEMRVLTGNRGPMHSQDACSQSENHLTLVRTSRHLGHNLQKAVLIFYVGNTFGHDLSFGQDLSSTARLTIRILLGACGDIRNLLKTVSRLDSHLNPHSMVQVVLNDNNVVLLARDVLLLFLIAQRTAAADVLAIWANHALKISQHKLLNDALATLAIALPEWLVLPEDSNLLAGLLDVFTSWRDCTMTLQELLDMRKRTLTLDSSFSASEKKYMREHYRYGDVDQILKVVKESLGDCHIHCFDKEIKKHITCGNVGNVTKEMQSPNPTFLDSPSLQYQQHGATSVYRAISINAGSMNSGLTLYEILLNTVRPQLEAAARMLERGSLRVAVDGSDIVEGMLCGGFLRLLRQLDERYSPSASPILFDFIDLSNVSDYVSLPAVVQAAVPLLKSTKHAAIHAQSLMWCGLVTRDEPSDYLRCTTGLDLDTYQQLLGVKVHTQAVGVSNTIQMRWTWDLDAEEIWLTGAMVLLEVMAAAKFYCGIDRAHYVSNVCKCNRMAMSGPLWAGIENASPLTLLHWLYLTSPSIMMPIVHILVATNHEYRKREWELIGHAMLQQKALKSNVKRGEFVKVAFEANANFYMKDFMPLCLVFSNVALRRGEDVATTDVFQVLETISYFTESDRVEVMLQRSLAENSSFRSLFMTLCVAVNCTNLHAVGTSVPWTNLSIVPLSELPRWTASEGFGKRALLSDDLELLEMIAKQIEDASTQQSWKTHAMFETVRFVIVELLLPRPFPGANEVAIAVKSSGTSLTVTTRALEKNKAKKRFGFPETHVVELPTAVRSDGHSFKVSRKLCLMTVRLLRLLKTS